MDGHSVFCGKHGKMIQSSINRSPKKIQKQNTDIISTWLIVLLQHTTIPSSSNMHDYPHTLTYPCWAWFTQARMTSVVISGPQTYSSFGNSLHSHHHTVVKIVNPPSWQAPAGSCVQSWVCCTRICTTKYPAATPATALHPFDNIWWYKVDDT